MKKSTLHARPFFVKTILAIAVFIVSASFASAQHCEGCNVNIFGPEHVQVGDTFTYTVTPSNPGQPYTAIWDQYEYLNGYAQIIAQGQHANGDEYVTLYFYGSGYCWFTYYGPYSGFMDYDEFEFIIDP